MAEQNRGENTLVLLHALDRAGLYSSDESKKNQNLKVTLDEVL